MMCGYIFPSKAESEAIALSAVSNYDAPQSGEDRMSDPDNRYLRTKSGQELALAPGYIKLSCGKAASVSEHSDGWKGQNTISVYGEGNGTGRDCDSCGGAGDASCIGTIYYA